MLCNWPLCSVNDHIDECYVHMLSNNATEHIQVPQPHSLQGSRLTYKLRRKRLIAHVDTQLFDLARVQETERDTV